jgi:cytochrome bd-type quinol oxidase subunit 2
MMTALDIPMTVILIGIVLRGSAFVFRKYDSQNDPFCSLRALVVRLQLLCLRHKAFIDRIS